MSAKKIAQKFFVMFCKNNTHKPQMYKTMSSIKNKMKQFESLDYLQFKSELEAEKFKYPKLITYLALKEQFQKQGVQIQTMKKINNVENVTQGKQQQKQDDKQQQKQHKQQKKVKKIRGKSLKIKNQAVKQNTQKVQNKQKVHQSSDKQTPIENEQVKPIITNNQTKKQIQQQTIKMAESMINFAQLQSKLKQIAINQITKKNIKTTFEELLDIAGNSTQFQRSSAKTRPKSDAEYYGFFDGASKPNPGKSGAGYFIINNKQQIIFKRAINLGFRTNNQSEFMAMTYLMMDCKLYGITKLKIYGDSKLAIQGINGKYKIQDKKLKYLNILSKYFSLSFQQFSAYHIAREKNKMADQLSNDGIKQKYLGKNKFQYI